MLPSGSGYLGAPSTRAEILHEVLTSSRPQNENFITDNSATLSGFLRCCIQDIDLPDSSDGASVANGIGLAGFALAIIGGPIQFVSGFAAQAVTGIPEIGSSRLIGDIA